jgi:hypothetical protein
MSGSLGGVPDCGLTPMTGAGCLAWGFAVRCLALGRAGVSGRCGSGGGWGAAGHAMPARGPGGLAGAGLRRAGVPLLCCWRGCGGRRLPGWGLGALRAPLARRACGAAAACHRRPSPVVRVLSRRVSLTEPGRLRRLRAGAWGSALLTQARLARAGLACPGAAGLRGPGGVAAGGCWGLDVDLAPAGNGSAGAGCCFSRPWVMAVTPLCVKNLRRS